MANRAFRRPDMLRPQAVAQTKVTVAPVARTTPLLDATGGEFLDRIFRFAMLACGLAVPSWLAARQVDQPCNARATHAARGAGEGIAEPCPCGSGGRKI